MCEYHNPFNRIKSIHGLVSYLTPFFPTLLASFSFEFVHAIMFTNITTVVT